jgi:hypothetical protein
MQGETKARKLQEIKEKEKNHRIKTHASAQLHLQVYDLRRETKFRQARDWFAKNYIVNNDVMRIAPMGSEHGAYAGMVLGYWQQACALLNYELLHEDLFFETGGEFFGV